MNQRIEELAKELLSEIKKQKNSQDIKRGNTVTIAGREWLILKVEGNRVYCLQEVFDDERHFDSNSNDWRSSDLRTYLNADYYNRLVTKVGKENILPITTDLLSLDGQTEYGKSEDYISLLTIDLYRENRDILPNMNKWWWLASPWSTKGNEDEICVCVVSPLGCIYVSNCYDYRAVRPLCIFDSKIFESVKLWFYI